MTPIERILGVVGGFVAAVAAIAVARGLEAEEERDELERQLNALEVDLEYWRDRAGGLRRAAEVDDPTGAPIVYGLVALAGLLLGLGIAIVIGL